MTIDDRARAAASALHAEVGATTDTEAALAQVLSAHRNRPRRRLPLLAAAAAVLAVVAVSTAVVGAGDDGADDDEVSIEVDPDPDADPDGTPLQLLAPDDGRQSLDLPVSVDPAVDLADGQTVQVSGSGFEPGESVGVVQCTADAREPVYAGVDACRTSPFTQLTADANGDVRGEFTVSRTLTVPFSGTVDCAAAPGTCLVGVGALSDYDRSGGMVLDFAAAEGAVAPPAVELSRSTELGDGEVVHISGRGFTGEGVQLSVCATSPAVCWSTGTQVLTGPAVVTSAEEPLALAVAEDGTVDGEVAVWRFLPGGEPGTYVDCAVSACSLRFSGALAPPPVALGFAGTEDPPVAPVVQVAPAEGLRAGDLVEITGSGFAGSAVVLSFCASQPVGAASPDPRLGSGPVSYCLPIPADRTDVAIDEGGGFVFEAVLGSFDPASLCFEPGSVDCPPPIDAGWTFEVQAYVVGVDPGTANPPPAFDPLPVPVGFTP